MPRLTGYRERVHEPFWNSLLGYSDLVDAWEPTTRSIIEKKSGISPTQLSGDASGLFEIEIGRLAW